MIQTHASPGSSTEKSGELRSNCEIASAVAANRPSRRAAATHKDADAALATMEGGEHCERQI